MEASVGGGNELLTIRDELLALAEKEPAQVLEILFQNQEFFNGGVEISVLEQIARDDPDQLEIWFGNNPDGRSTPFFREWGAQQTEKCLFRVATSQDDEKRGELIGSVFSRLHRDSNWKSALDLLNGSGLTLTKREKNLGGLSLAQGVGRFLPSDAIAILEQVDENGIFGSMKERVYVQLIKVDLKDPDPSRLVSMYEGLTPKISRKLLNNEKAMEMILKKNPASVFQLVGKVSFIETNISAYEKVATSLGKSDAGLVSGWLSEMIESPARTRLFEALGTSVDVSDPKKFLSSIQSVEPAERSAVLRGAALTMARADFESALEFSANLDGAERREFELSSITAVRNLDSQKSANELTKLLNRPGTDATDGSSEVTAVTEVGESLAIINPEEAVSWIDDLNPLFQLAAVRGLASGFAAKDPDRLVEWIESGLTTEHRNIGISELVKQLKETDPESAALWAKEISD
ncbi:MAG: hypothetical protein ACJAQT_002496 [Akkermansiaceae bacterium]